MSTTFRRWVPIALSVSLACFAAYVAAQQVMRHMADDPQIQMAEDRAVELLRGRRPEGMVGNDTVDVDRSIAPFVIIYDENGQPIASGARLDSVTPRLPHGVFDYTRMHGEDRITWQPRHGVRLATVIVHHGGNPPGFVLAARSLRESERRIDEIGRLLLALWLAAIAGALVLTALFTHASVLHSARQ